MFKKRFIISIILSPLKWHFGRKRGMLSKRENAENMELCKKK